MSELTQKEVLDTEPTHHDEHIVSPKVYGVIFGALLLGTAITVGASYLELGDFNVIVALAIACIKAVLVILLNVEGGTIGRVSENMNGTVDIGPMQGNACQLSWRSQTRRTRK